MKKVQLSKHGPVIVHNVPKGLELGLSLEIKKLHELRPFRALYATALNWGIIIGAMAIAINSSSVLIWVICALLIATRQHALLIIMHDAAHGLIFDSIKWNDRFIHWMVTYPFLFSVHGFRREHLIHHENMNTDKDPNWYWKARDPEWQFPKSSWSLLALCLRALFEYKPLLDRMKLVVRYIKKSPQNWKENRNELISATLYHFILWGSLLASGYFFEIVILWFFPMFTFLQVIMRLRVMAEHSGLSYQSDLSHARNYPGHWLERWLIAPENVSYHLCHHLYPGVPFYNLKRLDEHLRENHVYNKEAHFNYGFMGSEKGNGVWTDLCQNKVSSELSSIPQSNSAK